MTEIIVECHSGHTYAERPKAFYHGGERFEVETIEAEWLNPDGKHFRVRVRYNSIFELVYDQARDGWQIKEIRED